MPAEIRVLIADDHAVVRQGLRTFLGLHGDIEVVGEAVDGADAVQQVERLGPDVVLMDLVMPELDGIEATRLVKERAPGTQVVVLTSFSDDDRLFPALAAGASGYLMKDVPPEQLVHAIRTAHRGMPLLDPDVARRVLERVAQARREPEGTVTILFTDIEGSTALAEEIGGEGALDVLRDHDRIVRAALHEHGGVEVKHRGDGIMAAFSSARRAIDCAIAMQREIAERNRSAPVPPLRVRMGLNTGEVIAEAHDYFGEAVNLAARVTDAASGGQIFVSNLTRALAGRSEIPFADRGEHDLKGIREPQRLYEVVWEE